MSKMAKTMISIEGEKLYAAVINRGLKLSDVSERLGYTKSYISNCCMNNVLRARIVNDIANEFGIKYEEYAIEGAESKNDDEPKTITFTAEELTDIITQAVVMAFDVGQDKLYGAVYGALKKIKQEDKWK